MKAEWTQEDELDWQENQERLRYSPARDWFETWINGFLIALAIGSVWEAGRIMGEIGRVFHGS